MTNKKKLQLSLTPELYERIKALADKKGLSVNAMILILLDAELESRGE